MLKNLTILIFVLIAATAVADAQKNDEMTADETALRASVAQLAKGWNEKSGAEFAKPFAEDADYVVINGMQLKGRPAIDKGHQAIFDTIYKNTALALTPESVRFLRPDVAIVHVSAILKQAGDESGAANAKITLVMAKAGGKWEIAAFQNTAVQNAPSAKK
ncbi:MAG TPA: SgcJ/EcaC family oxidoreductase [Pyrinomonadaceae bacterium]|jgi:uncharacterized protein (TIGR02246 family)